VQTTERLAAWTTYYDALAAQHSKATDEMKKKSDELLKLETDIATQRKAAVEEMLALTEKLMIAQGTAATDESIYQMKLQAIEQERAEANRLSGEAQIKALETVKSKYAALTSEVTASGDYFSIETMEWVSGLQTVVTQEDAIKMAMQNVNSVQGDIVKAQEAARASKEAEIATMQAWQSTVESAMALAQAAMANYKTLIISISELLSKMDTTIDLKVNDQASGTLDAIKAKLDGIQSEAITVAETARQSAEAATTTPYITKQIGGGITLTNVGGGVSVIGRTTGVTVSNPGGWLDPNSGGYTNGVKNYGGWLEPGVMGDPSVNPGGWLNPNEGGYTNGVKNPGGWLEASYARDGAAFDRGNVIPFARGGIFDRPTIFPMARGYGLMGEAGPEVVMPLTRGAGGKLGIKASGGGMVLNISPGAIIINGINKSPEQVAKETAKAMKDEFRRLAAVGA